MINKKSLGVKDINKRKLVIEYVDPVELMPNSYNPNSHSTQSFDLLLKSLAVFGFTQPIVVERNSMTIIDGEHRWRAACVLDLEEVPVCFVDLNEEEMRLSTIIHNQARGKHSKQCVEEIATYLGKKGIVLSEELFDNRENKHKKTIRTK
jgi:ParB family chromosome partitioning protein